MAWRCHQRGVLCGWYVEIVVDAPADELDLERTRGRLVPDRHDRRGLHRLPSHRRLSTRCRSLHPQTREASAFAEASKEGTKGFGYFVGCGMIRMYGRGASQSP